MSQVLYSAMPPIYIPYPIIRFPILNHIQSLIRDSMLLFPFRFVSYLPFEFDFDFDF